MTSPASEGFEGWAIVELMGHRRLAGYVRDVELFGGRRLRLDVPKTGEPEGSSVWHATQFYGSSALYCVTPTDETTARRISALSQPAPVQAWELPQLPAPEREEPEFRDAAHEYVKCEGCSKQIADDDANAAGWAFGGEDAIWLCRDCQGTPDDGQEPPL